VALHGGIDLGGTKIEVVIVDDKHAPVAQSRQPTPTTGGPPAVVEAIVKGVREAAKPAGVEPSALAGLGVGSPGEVEGGTVSHARNLPDWERSFPLAPAHADQLGLPVVVENQPGGTGLLATRAIATAPPAGYPQLPRNPGAVDIPAALEARRYSMEGSVIFEVKDSFMPENAGRYELQGGRDGATCRRTGKSHDLALDVTDLGAAYLGNVSLSVLGRAGRVEEKTPGALARADALFSSEPAPWCATHF